MAEISQNVEVGILASLIGAFTLMLRWATQRFGKPATNQALDLAAQSMTLLGEFKDTANELKEAVIGLKKEFVHDREQKKLEAKQNTEQHQGIVDALNALKQSNNSEHEKQNTALAAIEPAINTLTQQLIQTESRIDSNMETQTVTNQEILEALLRIEKDVQEIKRVNADNAERIEKTEQDLRAVRGDLMKRTGETKVIKEEKPLSPEPTPAPDNQPVVMPKPEPVPPVVGPVTNSVTPTETKTEKDKPND